MGERRGPSPNEQRPEAHAGAPVLAADSRPLQAAIGARTPGLARLGFGTGLYERVASGGLAAVLVALDAPGGRLALEDVVLLDQTAPVIAVLDTYSVERAGAMAALGADAVIGAHEFDADSLDSLVGETRAHRSPLGGPGPVLDALAAAVLVVSASGRVVRSNAEAASLLGLGTSEPSHPRLAELGVELSESDADEGRDRFAGAEAVLAASSRTDPRPVLLRRRDGTVRHLEVASRPLRREGERLAYAAVVSLWERTDAGAEQRRAAEAVRRRLVLLEDGASALVLLDAAGEVREADAWFERLVPAGRLVGSRLVSQLHPDDRARFERQLEAALSSPGRRILEELRVLDVAGVARPVEVSLVNRLAETKVHALVGTVRESTGGRVAREAAACLASAVAASNEAVLTESPDGTVTSWNASAGRLLGWNEDEIVGSSALVLVPDDELEQVLEDREALRAGGSISHGRVRRRRPDGGEVEVSLVGSAVLDGAGEPLGAVFRLGDLAGPPALELERLRAEEHFRLGFYHGATGMAVVDLDDIVTRANPAFCALLGRGEDEVVGRCTTELLVSGEEGLVAGALARDASGDEACAERRFVAADGSTVLARVETTVVRDESGAPAYLFCQIEDQRSRRANEAALEHAALHDALTGLANRVLLEGRLEQAIARCDPEGSRVAVVSLDLDRFALVNERLGHDGGDRLLVDLARRLSGGARAGDVLARLGGDQFVLVCENVADGGDADEIVARFAHLLDAPFLVDSQALSVSASLGLSLVGPGTSVDEALRSADAAMVQAKARGRDRTVRFDEGLRRELTERFDLAGALGFALERRELRVAYQPIVRVADGSLVGVEALCRWDHPVRGAIAPVEFIALAEESGLIVDIGAFVLEDALGRIERWRRSIEGGEHLWVSVNCSARELSVGDPAERTRAALERHALAPGALRLELTESTLTDGSAASLERLAELAALGVGIVVDDYGTGYSSLSYLARLPVSLLKVDRSFVSSLGTETEDRAIVRAVAGVAEVMHLELCAEGVERAEQRRALADLGCAYGQGYLWSRPLTPEAFEVFAGAPLALAR